jgi:hypothetical protein
MYIYVHLNLYTAEDTCTFICVRPIQIEKDNQSEFSLRYFIYGSCFIKKEYISIPTVVHISPTHIFPDDLTLISDP